MRLPLLLVALSAVLLGACYSAGEGQTPPLESLYFPTGLALDVFTPAPSVGPVPQPEKAQHLYVASSDFDLQYKASALASYDLHALEKYLPQSCNTSADCSDGQLCDSDSADPSYFCVEPAASGAIEPCGALGEHSPADQLLYPGRCASIDPRAETDLIASTVQIGAFATDVVFRIPPPTVPNAKYPGRLFLPVRGDATLHWIDVDTAGQLHCGQENTPDDSCDDAHRIGDDEYTESPNMLRQEPEPFAIAVADAVKKDGTENDITENDQSENIAVTNQTTGSVSLYVNHWAPDAKPELVYLLTGLPTAVVGITAVPQPLVASDADNQPAFLAVYRNAPQVDLLRVRAADSPISPPLSYQPRVLDRAASVAINANSIGYDSRGIVLDDAQRRIDYGACLKSACIADPGAAQQKTGGDLAKCQCGPDPTAVGFPACQQALQTCLQAVHQPSVFVSNRAPASVLVGALTPDFSYLSGTGDLPAFTDSVPLTAGPSRVVLGKVRVPGSDFLDDQQRPYGLERRVFIVCFDSRRIYIYDPVRRIIDSIVATGRGPFALAIDEGRGLGYVAHFTDSYLGVISLDQRFPKNYAAIVASIGVPSPPRASK